MSTEPTEPRIEDLDPDSDPGNLTEKAPRQPDQAEGADDPAKTGET